MTALVVYESMFGNTALIARAVGEGLAEDGPVTVIDVNEAPTTLAGADLLLVGAPTHAFGLSRPTTRESAVKEGADEAAATGIGVREWIQHLEDVDGTTAAVFDTRVRRPRLPGSAARKARRRLRRHGLVLAEPAMSFWVDGTSGPLVAGEEERARRWARDLVRKRLGTTASR